MLARISHHSAEGFCLMPRRVLERPNLGEICGGSPVTIAVVQHYVDYGAYLEA